MSSCSSPNFERLFRNGTEGDSSAPVLGHLPEWLKEKNLNVIYNGPVGLWDLEKQMANTWFDGLSLLTSFSLSPGEDIVRMRKRFLRSTAFEKANAHGKFVITEYGTAGSPDPDKGIVARTISSIIPGEMTDNCACSIATLSGVTVALTETSLLRVVNPKTLETGVKVDLSSKVNIMSGRPLTDPSTGDIYNIAATFTTGLKYHFVKFQGAKINGDPQAILESSMQIVASIPSRMKTCFAYYHSFAMTEDYLVFIEQPWVANSMKLISSKVKGQSLKDCLEWYPEEKNLFHIVNKVTGEVLKVKHLSSEPFFLLNHVNAFQDPATGDVIVDIIGYDDPTMLEDLTLERLRSGQGVCDKVKQGRLMRFELPLEARPGVKVLSEQKFEVTAKVILEERGCEHPVVNRHLIGRPYKYTYVIGWMCSKGYFANAVTKVNMSTGETVRWLGDEFCHPSEAVFLPGGGSSEEDDGVVVACVTDVRPEKKDFLLFLDARNMTEVARASFDEDVPFTAHATATMG